MMNDLYLAICRTIDNRTPHSHNLGLIKAQCLSHLGRLSFTGAPAQATDGSRKGKLAGNWIEEISYFLWPYGCVCNVQYQGKT